MHTLLALLLLAAAAPDYPVRGASAQFDVTVRPEFDCADPDDALAPCIGPATLVFTGAGAAPPLHVDAIKPELDDAGRPRVNEATLYGAQSMIAAGDFDFDGHDDLAVRTGDEGPYGGPSYEVFRFDRAQRRFVHDEALTALALETLGLFGVDATTRRLSTWAKSGCCWHQYAEYEWRDGTLIAVFRRTEDAMGEGDVEVTEERLGRRGRWHARHRREPRQD